MKKLCISLFSPFEDRMFLAGYPMFEIWRTEDEFALHSPNALGSMWSSIYAREIIDEDSN